MERFLRYLENDGTNIMLLADAAEAAFDARQFDLARNLIDKCAQNAPLAERLVNLRAMIGLATGAYEQAAIDLERLRTGNGDAPALRFNLAWAYAMLDRFDEANALLDTATVASSPRGASLKIQMLHHLDLYDEALELGSVLAESQPGDEALMGALATLAMDAGRPELAKTYAQKAGSNPEGLTARGLFALDDSQPSAAMKLFDAAIERQPANPRAWLGKGLSLLSSDQAADAASAIDKGAGLFGDHLGSWIAAGWAHFIAGDLAAARDRFERVVALDATFAEGHGGIAVIDAITGDMAKAERNCAIALRLDPKCMSGALAGSLMKEAQGERETAERIRALALKLPIGPGGKTITQALAASSSSKPFKKK